MNWYRSWVGAHPLLSDVLERAVWTAAQGALGVLAAHQADIPIMYAAIFAAGISAAKGVVASHLGTKGTASTLPDPTVP